MEVKSLRNTFQNDIKYAMFIKRGSAEATTSRAFCELNTDGNLPIFEPRKRVNVFISKISINYNFVGA